MCISGKMRSIPGMGEGEIKEDDGRVNSSMIYFIYFIRD
jgi:hypothetical protein